MVQVLPNAKSCKREVKRESKIQAIYHNYMHAKVLLSLLSEPL